MDEVETQVTNASLNPGVLVGVGHRGIELVCIDWVIQDLTGYLY
jgi:hypothetical protein